MFPSKFWHSRWVMILAIFAFMVYDFISGNVTEAIIGFIMLMLFVFFYSYLKNFADSTFNKIIVAIFLILIALYIIYYIFSGFITV